MEKFWEEKELEELNKEEWESLCDLCGLCCLFKHRNAFTKQPKSTYVICKRYDCSKKACGAYSDRLNMEELCFQLTPKVVRSADWLPDSCAYRLVAKGEPLPDTHHLISGSFSSQKTVADIHGVENILYAGLEKSIERCYFDYIIDQEEQCMDIVTIEPGGEKYCYYRNGNDELFTDREGNSYKRKKVPKSDLKSPQKIELDHNTISKVTDEETLKQLKEMLS